MRLLIIEDEQTIARPLKKILERKGFAVDYAEDGTSGLKSAQMNTYDCILLDLNLPGIDGITLSDTLRKTNDTTPIIMVTARSQTFNKIEGFDSGADDYVTKPFNINELVARINAVIKRSSRNKEEVLRFDTIALTPEKNTARVTDKKGNTKEVDLSNKETGILEYLLRNKEKIVSAEELLEHVWDEEVDMFTETIKTHIKTLRKKVDPRKKIIKTIRGKGYTIR